VFQLLRERTHTFKFTARSVWSESVPSLRHGIGGRHHVPFRGRDPGVQGFRDGTLLKRFTGLCVRGTRTRQQEH
jgi:hypothetical protein